MDTSNAETGPFDEIKAAETQETQQINLQSYQLARDISRRQTRSPVRYGYTDLIAYALMSAKEMSIEEPFSYSKASESENCDKWIEGMRKEMDSLQRNQMWTLVPNPSDKKLVNCKWIFKKKNGIPRVEPSKFKVRLMAGGFIQRKSVDFNEIFSPIVKHGSIRILLTMATLLVQSLSKWMLKLIS